MLYAHSAARIFREHGADQLINGSLVRKYATETTFMGKNMEKKLSFTFTGASGPVTMDSQSERLPAHQFSVVTNANRMRRVVTVTSVLNAGSQLGYDPVGLVDLTIMLKREPVIVLARV
jgi:hypothetical protein